MLLNEPLAGRVADEVAGFAPAKVAVQQAALVQFESREVLTGLYAGEGRAWRRRRAQDRDLKGSECGSALHAATSLDWAADTGGGVPAPAISVWLEEPPDELLTTSKRPR